MGTKRIVSNACLQCGKINANLNNVRKQLINPTFVWRNARDLFTFSILCTRIRPLLGLANRSPEMISSNFSNFLPSARSVNKSSTSIRACKVKVIDSTSWIFFCADILATIWNNVSHFYKYFQYYLNIIFKLFFTNFQNMKKYS